MKQELTVKLEVFDPAMCCSTGVCGPNPNPALAPFQAGLDWVAAQGIAVRRYNLGQEPGTFAEQAAVRTLLQAQGEAALPVVILDGAVRSTGRYPSRDELGEWAGIAAAPKISTALITELASIGAAVGANCEMCLRYHFKEAINLGLTLAELDFALRAAQSVKDVPASNMAILARKLVSGEHSTDTAQSPVVAIEDIAEAPASEAAGACCGSEAAAPCCGEPELVQVAAGSAPSGRCC
jgi:AhpD family alkylhydroperoxidase